MAFKHSPDPHSLWNPKVLCNKSSYLETVMLARPSRDHRETGTCEPLPAISIFPGLAIRAMD